MYSNSQIYCGNNKLATSITNGTQTIGTCASCQTRGYAVAMGVHTHEDKLLRDWIKGRYEPIIKQKLWYEDSKPVPPAFTQATLHQCFERGFASGSFARAAKFRKAQTKVGNAPSPGSKASSKKTKAR